ncbi:FAD-binding domain-containing protein, partial [Lentithecium fluviatile CBS 122367]
VYGPSSDVYETETKAMWSQAAWLNPSAVFVPSSPQQLADAVALMAQSNVSFSVRSGGHMPVPGHASLHGKGVLIGTTRLTGMRLVSLPNDFDAPYLAVGPGHNWKDIYDFLGPHDLIAVGGRVVGVGSSLLLGGGISFFSGMYGFAANNVVNFEILLASGEIISANRRSHPDLFWALKGGSNNFGIVVRYDIKVYPEGNLWGGAVAWEAEHTRDFLEAQTEFMSSEGGSSDPRAAIMSNMEIDAAGTLTSGAMLVFSGHDTSAMDGFKNIPAKFSSLAHQKFNALIAPTGMYSARDKRTLFMSTSIQIGNRTMGLVHDELVATSKAHLKGVQCSVGTGVQLITRALLEASKASGGDALDLDPNRGAFCVVLIYAYWERPEDDAKVNNWARQLLEAVEKRSQAEGLHHPFKYLNDAGTGQSPFETYGYGRSLPRLREISRKYDPHQVFQRLVPG